VPAEVEAKPPGTEGAEDAEDAVVVDEPAGAAAFADEPPQPASTRGRAASDASHGAAAILVKVSLLGVSMRARDRGWPLRPILPPGRWHVLFAAEA